MNRVAFKVGTAIGVLSWFAPIIADLGGVAAMVYGLGFATDDVQRAICILGAVVFWTWSTVLRVERKMADPRRKQPTTVELPGVQPELRPGAVIEFNGHRMRVTDAVFEINAVGFKKTTITAVDDDPPPRADA